MKVSDRVKIQVRVRVRMKARGKGTPGKHGRIFLTSNPARGSVILLQGTIDFLLHKNQSRKYSLIVDK